MSKRGQQRAIQGSDSEDGNACSAWDDMRGDSISSSQSSTPSRERAYSNSPASRSVSSRSFLETDEDTQFSQYTQSCQQSTRKINSDRKAQSEESPTPFVFNGVSIFDFLRQNAGTHLYDTSDEMLPDTFLAPRTTTFVNTFGLSKSKQRGTAAKPATVAVFGGVGFKHGMSDVTFGSASILTDQMPGFVKAMAQDISEQSYPQISMCAKNVNYRARLVFDFDLKIHHAPSFPDAYFLVLSLYMTQLVSELMSTYGEDTTLSQHDVARKVSSITAIRKSVGDNGLYQGPGQQADGIKVGMHTSFDVFCGVADAIIIRRYIIQRLQAEFELGSETTLFLIDQKRVAAAVAREGVEDRNAPPMWKYATKLHALTDDDIELFASQTLDCLHEIFTKDESIALRDATKEVVKIPLDTFFDHLPITGRMLRPPWTFKVDKKKDLLCKNIYVPLLAAKCKRGKVEDTVLLHALKPKALYAEAMIPLLIPNLTFSVDVSIVDPHPIFLRHPKMLQDARTLEEKSITSAIEEEFAKYAGNIYLHNAELPSSKKSRRETHLNIGEQTQLNQSNFQRVQAAHESALRYNSTIDPEMSTNMLAFVRKEIGDKPVNVPAIAMGEDLAKGGKKAYTAETFPFPEIFKKLEELKNSYPSKSPVKPYASNHIVSLYCNSTFTEITLMLGGHVYCPVKDGVHTKEGGTLNFFQDGSKKLWRVMFKCLCKHSGLPKGQPECACNWTGCKDFDWKAAKKKADLIDATVGRAIQSVALDVLFFKTLFQKAQDGRMDEVSRDITNLFKGHSSSDVFADNRTAEGTDINVQCTHENFQIW